MKKALLILTLAISSISLIFTSCSKDSSSGGSGGGGGSKFNVTTTTASHVTEYDFVTGGSLSNYATQNILEVGILYSSTTQNPNWDDDNTDFIETVLLDNGSFSCDVPANPGTTYYYRACAVYGDDYDPQIKYGNTKQVTTPGSTSPVKVTTIPGYISYYYGDQGYGYYLRETGGRIEILNGNHNITQKGMCYSKYNHVPNIDDNVVVCGSGVGDFSAELGKLSYSSTYYYCAYAKYDNGDVAYGMVYNATSGSKTGSYLE